MSNVRSINRVDLVKVYKMQLLCGNCEDKKWIEIPWGTPAKKYRYEPVCENCGVNEWHLFIEDHDAKRD